jgi:hypothetical protein
MVRLGVGRASVIGLVLMILAQLVCAATCMYKVSCGPLSLTATHGTLSHLLSVRGGEQGPIVPSSRNSSVTPDGIVNGKFRQDSNFTDSTLQVQPHSLSDEMDDSMLRTVDPMLIDDDIFSDGTSLIADARAAAAEEETPSESIHHPQLGSPPEPPSSYPPDQMTAAAAAVPAASVAYVPNMIEDEDDERDSAMYEAPAAIVPASQPSVADDGTKEEEEEKKEEITREVKTALGRALGHTESFLLETLRGAIEQQQKVPPFVPSIAQGLRSRLGPFRFKGFGYSFIKPVNRLDAVAVGLRIPISPCFPQYDANVGLPRLSSMLSLWVTGEESYLRWSFSTSLPSRVFCYYLAYLSFKARLMPRSVAEAIRLRRAKDSIKRIGCTVSIRLGTVTGLRFAIGPWLYYLPGARVMNKVLPYVFAVPALLIAVLNLFVDMEDALGWVLGLEPTIHHTFVGSGGASGSDRNSPYIDLDDDLSADTAAAGAASSIPPPPTSPLVGEGGEGEGQIKLADVQLWHGRLLKWAATKTTGLGFNAGFSKTQRQEAGMRQSVAFDIMPFFPSVDTIPMVLYRVLSLSRRIGAGLLSPMSSGIGGRGGANSNVAAVDREAPWDDEDDATAVPAWEEEDDYDDNTLYGSYRLGNEVRYRMRRQQQQHGRKRSVSNSGVDKDAAAAAQAAAGVRRVRHIKRPGGGSRPTIKTGCRRNDRDRDRNKHKEGGSLKTSSSVQQ